MDTDDHLVARARGGDDFAFTQLVHRHHTGVHRAARAIVGSAVDADDVAQDAWLHAYVHLARFQGTASFKTWVHAIARNRAIDHHRSARRRWCRATEALDAPDAAALRSDARSPEQLALDAELREQLATAVAELPARLRVLLELWHSGDYSYEELAQIAGVGLSTIKSRIWQGRRRVAQALVRPSLPRDRASRA